jgi:hypothetical protein
MRTNEKEASMLAVKLHNAAWRGVARAIYC